MASSTLAWDWQFEKLEEFFQDSRVASARDHIRAQELTESFPLLVALKDACPPQARVPRHAHIGEQYAGVQMRLCSPGSSHFWPTHFLVNTFNPVASNIHYAMKNSHLCGESMPFCYYNQLLMRKFHLEVPQVPHSSMYNVSHINSLFPPPQNTLCLWFPAPSPFSQPSDSHF